MNNRINNIISSVLAQPSNMYKFTISNNHNIHQNSPMHVIIKSLFTSVFGKQEV